MENLTKLNTLYLNHNYIIDISPLSNLTQLTELGLSNNNITDISPLSNLTQLNYVNLSDNPIPPSHIDWLQQQLPNCDITLEQMPF